MNIPYSTFYSTVGIENGVDATSGATPKAQNAEVAGAVYNGGGNVTESTDTSALATKGVQYAVKVDDAAILTGKDSKYTELKDDSTYHVYYQGHGRNAAPIDKDLTGRDALVQADDYAYYKLSSVPTQYLELDAKGNLTAGNTASVTAVDGTSVAADAIAYGQHWGSYVIDLSKFTETGLARESAKKIAGVKVVTDKQTFGLTSTSHIWMSFEIAWTPTGDLAASNGATLKSLEVYTDDGIYDITINQKLKTLYSDEVTAALDDTKGSISGLPTDISNAKATVSYTVGTGRSAVTTKVIEDAALADGSFAIAADAGLEDGKEYTVTVSSDNYIDIAAKTTYTAEKKDEGKTDEDLSNHWVDGKYWYENGIRQGTEADPNGTVWAKDASGSIRGREIYDPESNAWYWLDADNDGAKAVDKEVFIPYVYKDELKKDLSDDEIHGLADLADDGLENFIYNSIKNKDGKWVRYDSDGKMLKGWVTIEGKLAETYPKQAGNTYYYDNKTGAMAKGDVTIEGKEYHFDEVTGVLKK